jgi:hypothetical protein
MSTLAAILTALLAVGGSAPAPRALTAFFFVARDCPISNHYAPEIRRICDSYASRGVECQLVYVDTALTDTEALAHARAYGHDGYPIVIDRDRKLVQLTGARITPEVAVVNAAGVAYLGRIDDFFAALGISRRSVRDRTLRNALDALLAGQPAPQPRTQAVGCYITETPDGAAAPGVRE